MSTVDQTETTDYAARLRELCVGCRLSKTKWGVKKALDKQQKERAADVFGAVAKQLSASKTLIDTTDERYRAVTKIFSQITDDWKTRTLPYPEDGLRLIRREHIDDFEQCVARHQTDLNHAVAALNAAYGSLLSQAQASLGSLFQLSDYPSSLEGLFAISVEYPSVEPDPSLVEVSAGLYQRERQRIAARFDEALEMAETAFTAEFQGLITHLCEKLQGWNDGTVKQFRDSNVANLTDFFNRFKDLSIGSNADLEQLVSDVQQAVRGIPPEWLRESQPLRESIHSKLATVQTQLDEMMVARPKRAISFHDE